MPSTHDAAQRRGPWQPAEDNKLLDLIEVHGPENWVKLSELVGTRTAKQCRERYHQKLKPDLNHNPITEAEGAHIAELYHRMGPRWAEISRLLGNRSDNAVKNYWNGSQNRQKRDEQRRHRHSYRGPVVHHGGYHHAHARSESMRGMHLQQPLPQLAQYPHHPHHAAAAAAAASPPYFAYARPYHHAEHAGPQHQHHHSYSSSSSSYHHESPAAAVSAPASPPAERYGAAPAAAAHHQLPPLYTAAAAAPASTRRSAMLPSINTTFQPFSAASSSSSSSSSARAHAGLLSPRSAGGFESPLSSPDSATFEHARPHYYSHHHHGTPAAYHGRSPSVYHAYPHHGHNHSLSPPHSAAAHDQDWRPATRDSASTVGSAAHYPCRFDAFAPTAAAVPRCLPSPADEADDKKDDKKDDRMNLNAILC